MSGGTITSVSLQIDGVAGAIVPSSLRVDEVLHAPRRIVVTAPGSALDVSGSALLRRGAQIDVTIGGAAARRFEGILLEIKESWRPSGTFVVLTIGSALDLLSLSTDCRIFQGKTMPEIVEQVLKDAGVPAARIVTRLTGSYAPLESCTQYRETMLAFVTRLLEDDGAHFFLEDGDGGPFVVLGDSADAHRACTPATLRYVTERGLSLSMPAVTSLAEVEALRPSKVTLRDLDWKRPNLDLEATSPEERTARPREVHDHVGGYVTPADGARRAAARIESFVSSASGITGAANVPALAPGKTFALEDAPRAALAVEWLVVQASHTWSADGDARRPWRCSFRAIPKSAPFRPRATVPRPRVRGPETAIVTGPSGQEIHTDEHGRVRLKFPWDRHGAFDDKSSPWIRVAQTAMPGGLAIPRVGWEVLVEFEHGDPDRPVVVGRLYNATYLPPYPLPAKKTVTTLMSFTSPDGAGHNELRIDDAAGAEHIHVHAQRDLELKVDRERRSRVTASRMVTVQEDEAVTVRGHQSLEVKGRWEVTVAGTQTLDVDGERTKTVKKDEKITVNGDRAVTITGSHVLSTEASATFLAGGDVARTVAGALTEESTSGATSLIVGDDMSVTIGGPETESVKEGKHTTTDGSRSLTVGGARISVSGGDASVLVGGDRTSNVGAAWTVSSAADVQLTSRDALDITVGGALTMTGAAGIALTVGSSKVLIGQGGVVIEASKVKLTSDGPAALLAALVGSK